MWVLACMCVNAPYTCLILVDVRRQCQIPRNWSHRWLELHVSAGIWTSVLWKSIKCFLIAETSLQLHPFFWDTVSLCSPGCWSSPWLNQAALKSQETHRALIPEFGDERLAPPRSGNLKMHFVFWHRVLFTKWTRPAGQWVSSRSPLVSISLVLRSPSPVCLCEVWDLNSDPRAGTASTSPTELSAYL